MDRVAYVLKRAKYGCEINAFRDNGTCWAEVRSRWPWGRSTVFSLTREQYEILRYALIRERKWRPCPDRSETGAELAGAA